MGEIQYDPEAGHAIDERGQDTLGHEPLPTFEEILQGVSLVFEDELVQADVRGKLGIIYNGAKEFWGEKRNLFNRKKIDTYRQAFGDLNNTIEGLENSGDEDKALGLRELKRNAEIKGAREYYGLDD